MPAELSISSIAHVRVNTHDLERSTAFYRDVLKMPFLFDFPGFAIFDCQGTRIILATPEYPEEDHPSSVIAFRVDNIHEACRVLHERGVEFLGKPKIAFILPEFDLWLCRFYDPDRNILALRSDVKRKS